MARRIASAATVMIPVIHIGASTHTHDQSMKPVSLSMMKATDSRPTNGVPQFIVQPPFFEFIFLLPLDTSIYEIQQPCRAESWQSCPLTATQKE